MDTKTEALRTLQRANRQMREALEGLLREIPAPHKNIKKSFHYVLAIETAKKALCAHARR